MDLPDPDGGSALTGGDGERDVLSWEYAIIFLCVAIIFIICCMFCVAFRQKKKRDSVYRASMQKTVLAESTAAADATPDEP